MYLAYPKRNALRVMLLYQRFVPDLDVFGLFCSCKYCTQYCYGNNKQGFRSNDNNGEIKNFLFFDGNNFPGIFDCFKGGVING